MPKILFAQSATLIAIVIWVIKLLIGAKVEIKRGYLDVAVLFLFLAMGVSTLFSVSWPVSVFGRLGRYGQSLIAFFNFFLLYFIAAQLDWTPRRRDLLFKVMIAAATVVSVYGLLQYFGFNLFNFEAEFPVRRSFATIGNPNLLGGYLALVFPLSFALFLTQKGGGKLWGLAAAVILLALITTFSRGSWLAVIISSLIFVFLYFNDRRAKIVAVAGLTVFLIIILVVIAVFNGSSKELNPVYRFTELINIAGSAASRLEIWRGATEMATTRPLLGYGPDTFRLIFPQFQSLRHAQLNPGSLPDQAHNSVLQLAATVGFPAALLAVLIMGLYIRKVGDRIRRCEESGERLIHMGILMAGVSYFLVSLTTISTIEGDIILWTLMGMASGQSSRYWVSADSALRKNLKAAAATAAVILSLPLAYAIFIPYRAEAHFRQGDVAGRYNNLVGVELHFQEALKLNPYPPDYWEGLAKIYAFRSSSDSRLLIEEADFLRQVVAKQPYEFAFHIKLAKVYILLSEQLPPYREKAVTVLKQALKISPNLAKARYYLGVVYLREAEFDLAVQELNRAVLTDPNNPEAYFSLGYGYERLKQKGKAAEFYKKALSIKPTFSKASARLVQLERLKTGE